MRCDVVKVFDLLPPDRDACTFSDVAKVRLPEEYPHGLILKKNASGTYPTDNDLYVKGPLFQPAAVRQWVALDADVTTPKNTQGSQVTLIQWRLNDGTNDYYWNGAAWALAGLSNWNTLAVLQTNFATFPATAHKIRFIANLKTTDKTLAPRVASVRMAYKAEIRSFNDLIIHRTLVAALKAYLLPQTDLAMTWAGGTTTDLDNLSQEESLTISDVHEVYNYTDDPDLNTNLKSSYDPATKVLVLTSAVAANKRVLLRVVYAPTIAHFTHNDYNEIAGLPAVTIENVDEDLVSDDLREHTFVDRSTGNAIAIPAARQTDVSVTIRCQAAREVEGMALADEVHRFFKAHPTLTISALDQRVGLVLEQEPRTSPAQGEMHLHTTTFRVKIVGAMKWLSVQHQGYGIKRVVVSGDMNVTIE